MFHNYELCSILMGNKLNKYIVTVVRTKAGEVSINAVDACEAGMKALDTPEEELSNLREVSQYYKVGQEKENPLTKRGTMRIIGEKEESQRTSREAEKSFATAIIPNIIKIFKRKKEE